MNRRKQFRAVATRFDTLACRYQATIAIADILSGYAPDPTTPQAIRETRPSAPTTTADSGDNCTGSSRGLVDGADEPREGGRNGSAPLHGLGVGDD